MKATLARVSRPVAGFLVAALLFADAPSSTRAADDKAGDMPGGPVRAKQVVFVLDSTGSMIAFISFAKAELHKTVDSLDAAQRFNVILVKDRKIEAYSNGKLLPAASNKAKQECLAWLEKVTVEGNHPVSAAIEAALKLKPEAIYVLSDFVLSKEESPDRIKKLNGGKTPIPIFTTCYQLTNAPNDKAVAAAEKIAKDSGGESRVDSHRE